jgi:hypothetical protein
VVPSWKFRLDAHESWKLKLFFKFKEISSEASHKFRQVALARA